MRPISLLQNFIIHSYIEGIIQILTLTKSNLYYNIKFHLEELGEKNQHHEVSKKEKTESNKLTTWDKTLVMEKWGKRKRNHQSKNNLSPSQHRSKINRSEIVSTIYQLQKHVKKKKDNIYSEIKKQSCKGFWRADPPLYMFTLRYSVRCSVFLSEVTFEDLTRYCHRWAIVEKASTQSS